MNGILVGDLSKVGRGGKGMQMRRRVRRTCHNETYKQTADLPGKPAKLRTAFQSK